MQTNVYKEEMVLSHEKAALLRFVLLSPSAQSGAFTSALLRVLWSVVRKLGLYYLQTPHFLKTDIQ